MSPRAIPGSIVAIVAGGLVLFLEIWTVIPAPTLPTLAIAVVVPELTAWAIPACALAGVIAQLTGRGWARWVGVLASAAALGFALLPYLLLAPTITDGDHRMAAAFGARYASTAGTERPYSLGVAFAGFRPGLPVRIARHIPVPLRDGKHLGLDLYRPATRGAHPAIIVISGGAWIFGSRADSASLATTLAQRGYTAIAIDYRHAPRFEFPTQLDDVDDALAAIARHAAAWQVDPHRVAVFGRSAGAELALLAAYEPGPLTIRAAVGYYAPTDLVSGYLMPPRPDPADVDRILRAYLGGTPEQVRPAYRAASPVSLARPGLPPTLLITGDRDELVLPAFAHELRDALRSHGVAVAALDIPWSNHVFDSIPNGTGGQLAHYYTERFFSAMLGP